MSYRDKRDQTAERSGGDRRRQYDQPGIENLMGRHPAEQKQKRQYRQHAEQQQSNRQQAAEHLAQNDLSIGHIGEQEQNECPAIFFPSDRARRREGREKSHQREGHDRVQLEEQQAEACGLAESRFAAETARGQPSGDAEGPKQTQRRDPAAVMSGAARDGQEFSEDRPEHKPSPLTGEMPFSILRRHAARGSPAAAERLLWKPERQGPTNDRMRVLMLDIDGLQPAYLGPYGCEWAPTPTWDGLAVAGVVFDRHFADCSDPKLKPSWRTGQHPLLGDRAATDLVRELRAAGVRMARVGPTTGDDDWDIDISAKRGMTEPLALTTTRRAARAAIEEIGDASNAFLRIEIDALLPPWRPSDAAWADCYGDLIDVSNVPWTDELPERIDVDDDKMFERIQNSYAAAVATLDVSLGRLLLDCSKRGWGDDALWILTASRGFPLGEHGVVGFRGADLHEELVHLPLLLRMPRGDHARRPRERFHATGGSCADVGRIFCRPRCRRTRPGPRAI